jgi:sugar phosphate isomerase/epimerase
MNIQLALNTGFAVNRLTPPEQWIPYVTEVLGVSIVQCTADMFNPYLKDSLGLRIAEQTRSIAEKYQLRIGSTFTGAFTRLNHFSHPDEDVRRYWIEWFKAFVDISVILGSDNMGSHFGIMTMPDCNDYEIREKRFRDNIDCWRKVADYAAASVLSFLTWEPMSIPREYGETLDEVDRIQDSLTDFAIPMLLCLDVDHGEVASQNSDDTNPYRYLERYGSRAPLVHLKQSCEDKSGHWPFTDVHNQHGKIIPGKVIEALSRGGATDVLFVLEFNFRERTPAELATTDELIQSVEYWNPYSTV